MLISMCVCPVYGASSSRPHQKCLDVSRRWCIYSNFAHCTVVFLTLPHAEEEVADENFAVSAALPGRRRRAGVAGAGSHAPITYSQPQEHAAGWRGP